MRKRFGEVLCSRDRILSLQRVTQGRFGFEFIPWSQRGNSFGGTTFYESYSHIQLPIALNYCQMCFLALWSAQNKEYRWGESKRWFFRAISLLYCLICDRKRLEILLTPDDISCCRDRVLFPAQAGGRYADLDVCDKKLTSSHFVSEIL